MKDPGYKTKNNFNSPSFIHNENEELFLSNYTKKDLCNFNYPECKKDLQFITLTIESSFFRPIMEFNHTAIVYIDYGDSNEAISLNVNKGVNLIDRYEFSDGKTAHVVKINVTPWEALSVLNIGFRGGDGGGGKRERELSGLPYIEFNPTFEELGQLKDSEEEKNAVYKHVGVVTSVSDLSIASNLIAFCCEYQPIDSVDLSYCTKLLTLESYHSTIKTTNFQECTSLLRCCIESTGAQYNRRLDNGKLIEDETLDLRDSPNIRDIRGSNNNHKMVRFHPIAINSIWHFCMMKNLKLTSIKIGDEEPQKLDLSRFSNLIECYISYSPILERLRFSDDNSKLNSIWVSGCKLYKVNLQQQTQLIQLRLKNNPITDLDISECYNLEVLHLDNCTFNQKAVDRILSTFNEFNTYPTKPNNSINLGSHNAPPSKKGMLHAMELRDRGWNVVVNEKNQIWSTFLIVLKKLHDYLIAYRLPNFFKRFFLSLF